jgi:hypothetical protein
MLWRPRCCYLIHRTIAWCKRARRPSAFTPAEGGFVAENLTPLDDEAQAYRQRPEGAAPLQGGEACTRPAPGQRHAGRRRGQRYRRPAARRSDIA